MRSPSHRSRTALLVVVLVAPALAGCGVLDGGPDLPSGEDAAEKLASLDAVEGTRFIEDSMMANNTTSYVVRRPSTGEQRTAIRSGPSAGLVTVSNGTTTWLYNRSANEVQVLHFDGAGNATNSSSTVRTIFARLTDSADESTPADISQLPVVPAPGGGAPTPATGSLSFYGNVSLSFNGTETVAGRETFEVHIEPLGNESIAESATIWFDTTWYYPLKSRTALTLDGERQVVTTAFRNVTFNPEIPDRTFQFDPPANATVVETNYSSQSYDSRAALAAAVEMDVPDPSVPEDFSFESGSATTYDGNRSISLRYTNGSATVYVSKRSATGGGSGAGDAERVDVGGHTGRLSAVAGDRLLSWSCEGASYTVTGPLAREEIVALAESMACE